MYDRVDSVIWLWILILLLQWDALGGYIERKNATSIIYLLPASHLRNYAASGVKPQLFQFLLGGFTLVLL